MKLKSKLTHFLLIITQELNLAQLKLAHLYNIKTLYLTMINKAYIFRTLRGIKGDNLLNKPHSYDTTHEV
jgi:hypothetical protein